MAIAPQLEVCAQDDRGGHRVDDLALVLCPATTRLKRPFGFDGGQALVEGLDRKGEPFLQRRREVPGRLCPLAGVVLNGGIMENSTTINGK